MSMGTRNPNHRNYFVKNPIAPDKEVVLESPLEEVTLDENKVTVEYLYSLTKKEQIDLLEEIGFSKTEIKKLKYEKDRVEELINRVGVE